MVVGKRIIIRIDAGRQKCNRLLLNCGDKWFGDEGE
jgi:hypothetical protein